MSAGAPGHTLDLGVPRRGPGVGLQALTQCELPVGSSQGNQLPGADWCHAHSERLGGAARERGMVCPDFRLSIYPTRGASLFPPG